jgi:ERCC4-type nuclease
MIIIDEREFSLISLFEEKERKFTTSSLEAGDVLIVPKSKKYGKGIIVERKEIDHDFYGSIYDGRLIAQMRAMHKLKGEALLILLLEGNFKDHDRKEEIEDIVYNFMLFKGINLIFTQSLKETFKFITKLNRIYVEKINERKKKWTEEETEKFKNAKNLRDIIKDYGISQKKKFKGKEATFLRMMMEIPNISKESAVAIALFCDCKFGDLVKKKKEIREITLPSSGKHLSENAILSLSEVLFDKSI